MTVLWGLVLGLVAAAPLCVQLSRPAPGLGAALAAVAAAFVLLHGGVLAVHHYAHEALVPFGSLAMLAFLAAVVAAVIRRELHR